QPGAPGVSPAWQPAVGQGDQWSQHCQEQCLRRSQRDPWQPCQPVITEELAGPGDMWEVEGHAVDEAGQDRAPEAASAQGDQRKSNRREGQRPPAKGGECDIKG